MPGFIRDYFSFDLIVQLREDLISVRMFRGDKKFEEAPYIAIETNGGNTTIREIGSKARDVVGPNIKVTNPFSHPRSLIANFSNAEKIIRHAIRSLYGSRLNLKPAPRIVMHPLEKHEGGLTEIEERALVELALGAGAREVLVYTGDIIDTKIDSYDTVKSRINAT